MEPLIDKNKQNISVKKNGSLNEDENGSDGDDTDSRNGSTADKVSSFNQSFISYLRQQNLRDE